MSSLLAFCALSFGFVPPAETDKSPAVSPQAFLAWFDAARQGKLEMPEAVLQRAGGYRYVFICGLFHERMPGYFAQNVKELRARGVPRTAIHLIKPDSQLTVEENLESVRAELRAIAAEGPEPLVVIGHSRGACDALAFALQNPKFVQKRIRALFLLQGPFGGTGLADYVAGAGEPMDGRMPTGYRLMGRALGNLKSRFLDDGRHGAITALNRRDSERFWKEMMEAHSAAVPIVASRTFYVTCRTRTSRQPVLQRITGSYLGTYYGPNDGLVALEDQSLPEFGTVLAVLDAGHSDLTRRFPAARAQPRLRNALVDAILMAVAAPEKRHAGKSDDATVRTSGPAQGRARRTIRNPQAGKLSSGRAADGDKAPERAP